MSGGKIVSTLLDGNKIILDASMARIIIESKRISGDYTYGGEWSSFTYPSLWKQYGQSLTNEEEEGYEPSVLSAFSMEIELQDCSLTDVVLEYRGTPQFHLQNQKIPLTIEETDGILSITADLDRVSPIVTDLGNNLIFRGVITYKGEEYSFSSRI